MGNWEMGGWFWFKFIIALPIRLVLAIPYFVIMPFSKNKAFLYYEKNVLLQKIDDWNFK